MSQRHLAFVSSYTRNGLGLIIAIKLLVDILFAHLSVLARFEKASVTGLRLVKRSSKFIGKGRLKKYHCL